MLGEAYFNSLIRFMGERPLKTLETFRERKYSILCQDVRGVMLQILTGEACELKCLPEEYLTDAMKRGEYFSPRLRNYLLPVERDGIPYRDFAGEPRTIVQIKKIFNALYHAEQGLLDLEQLDPDLHNKSADLSKLLGPITENIYEATYIATHLDPQVLAVFGPEFKLLLGGLSSIQQKAEQYGQQDKGEMVEEVLSDFLPGDADIVQIDGKEAIQQFESLRKYLTANNAGKVAGIAVGQLDNNNRQDIDFSFLANTLSGAPACIDKCTQLIRYYTDELATVEPNINKDEIKALQEDAVNIMQGLEDMYYSNRLFMPLKVLRYIRLLNHITSVTNSIVEQVGYAQDTSQESLAQKLAYLKYDLIQDGFAFSDKLEAYSMMRPGTLSDPLMQSMDKMYQELSHYVGKVVNFSVHGEDLRVLNENVFTYRRLETVRARLNEARTQRALCVEKIHALQDFYLQIDGHDNTELNQLPSQVLKSMGDDYRLIQQSMLKFDPEMHTRMISALFPDTKPPQGWLEWISDTACWLVGASETNTNWLQSLRPDLERMVRGELATIDFSIQLESDLIDKLKNSKTQTMTWHSGFSIYEVDERKLCQLPDETPVTEQQGCYLLSEGALANNGISIEQAGQLYEHYNHKLQEVTRAQSAFQVFVEICNKHLNKQMHQLLDKDKKQLLAHYKVFQPWLYIGNRTKSSFNASDWDRPLSFALQSLINGEDGNTTISTNGFIAMQGHFETLLGGQQSFYRQQATQWNDYFQEKIETIQQKIPIIKLPEKSQRQNYMLPRDDYSVKIAQYRNDLMNLRNLFGEDMQKALEATTNEKRVPHLTQFMGTTVLAYSMQSIAPYPEMEDPCQAYAQPEQVAAIKRLYNGMFYLEGVVRQLEQLNDNSLKTVYVGHLLLCYDHLNNMLEAAEGLYADPHCRFLAVEFLNRLSNIYQDLKPETLPYTKGSSKISSIDTPVKYEAFWGVMNAFLLLPEHLKSNNAQQIAPEVLARRQKQAKRNVTDIERIIGNSNSYLALFFETPTMVRLFFHLRSRINEFSKVTHEAAINNLAALDKELFFTMLREADIWEMRMGLQPGQLSAQLEEVLDKFYQGLIETLDLTSEQEFSLLFNHDRINHRLQCMEEDWARARRVSRNVSLNMRAVAALNETIKERMNQDVLTRGTDPDVATQLQANMNFLKGQHQEYELKKKVIAFDVLLEALGKMDSVDTDTQKLLLKTFQQCRELLITDERLVEPAPLSEADQSLQDRFDVMLRQEDPANHNTVRIERLAPLVRACSRQYRREVPLMRSSVEKDNYLHELAYFYDEKYRQEIPANLGGILSYVEALYKHEASTTALQQQIVQKHQAYGKDQKGKQIKQQEKLRQAYIERNYNRLVEETVNGLTGLTYGKEAYQKHLSQFIAEKKEQICSGLENKTDICTTLRHKISHQHEEFNNTHYDDYAKFSAIMTSLEEAEKYCFHQQKILAQREKNLRAQGKQITSDKHIGISPFETKDTFLIKRTCIKKLRDISNKETMPVKERIESMKEYININIANWEKDAKHSSFSWLWFKQWCYYLLSIVNLHEPKCKKVYQKLCESANLSPEVKRDETSIPQQTFFRRKRPASLNEDPDESPDPDSSSEPPAPSV